MEPVIMPVWIVSVMARFIKAVDFNLYRIENLSQRYWMSTYWLVICGTKHMEQMMRRYIFNGEEFSAVIKLVCTLVPTCPFNQNNEAEEMWLLPNLTAGSAESALISRQEQTDGEPTVSLLNYYCGLVNFLSARYESNENISKPPVWNNFDKERKTKQLLHGQIIHKFSLRWTRYTLTRPMHPSWRGKHIARCVLYLLFRTLPYHVNISSLKLDEEFVRSRNEYLPTIM